MLLYSFIPVVLPGLNTDTKNLSEVMACCDTELSSFRVTPYLVSYMLLFISIIGDRTSLLPFEVLEPGLVHCISSFCVMAFILMNERCLVVWKAGSCWWGERLRLQAATHQKVWHRMILMSTWFSAFPYILLHCAIQNALTDLAVFCTYVWLKKTHIWRSGHMQIKAQTQGVYRSWNLQRAKECGGLEFCNRSATVG